MFTIAEMKDPLHVRWSRPPPCAPSSVTVCRDAAGRYFASLLFDVEVSELPKSDKATAFDLGLSSFLTFADDRWGGIAQTFSISAEQAEMNKAPSSDGARAEGEGGVDVNAKTLWHHDRSSQSDDESEWRK